MKNTILTIFAALLLLSLTACVSTGPKDNTRVKCPACGYEFETEYN